MEVKIPTISLREYQKPHVIKIQNILTKFLACIDTSDMGLGKTYTSLWIAQYFQLNYGWKIAIIAPNNQCLTQDNGWLDLAKRYNIRIVWSTTYSSLTGRKGKFNHPYLYKPEKDKKTSFDTTNNFRYLCKSGLFLIFDECHKATRPNSQSHWASAALVKSCYDHNRFAKVLNLSGTPGNKEEHKLPLLRLSGFMRHHKLTQYNIGTGEIDWKEYALGDLWYSASKFCDPFVLDGCWEQLSSGSGKRICRNVYDICIKDNITTAMQAPDFKYQLTTLNIFLEIYEHDIVILNQGLDLLKGAVAWDNENNRIGPSTDWDLGDISQGLKRIELGKLGAIARYVMTKKMNDSHRKFVISVGSFNTEHQFILREMIHIPLNYQRFRAVYQCWKHNKLWKCVNKDIFRKIVKMSYYYPTVMNGKTKPEERVKIQKAFQTDSNDIDILIVSPGVASESISLHDLHGGRPRTLLTVPTYHFDKTCQIVKRIFRNGIQSDATAMLVYAKQGDMETKIIDSMIQKSISARSMIADGQKVIYPAEYPFWIEGEKDEKLEAVLEEMRQRALNN